MATLPLPPLFPIPLPGELPENPRPSGDLPAHNEILAALAPQIQPEWRPVISGIYDWVEYQAGSMVATLVSAIVGSIVNAVAGFGELTGQSLGVVDAAIDRGKRRIIAETRQTPLDPEALIQLVFRSQLPLDAAKKEAAWHGLSDERFAALVATLRPLLDRGTAEELVRRKVISTGDCQEALRRLGYDGETIQLLLSIIERPFSAENLAVLAARRQEGGSQLRDTAESQGTPGWQFDYLLELLRTYFSPQDYLTLERRGTIQKGDTDKKLKALQYTQEELLWFRDLHAILLDPATLAQLVRRGEIKPEAGLSDSKRQGYTENQFNQLVTLTRQFLTPFEYGQLLLRGKLTDEKYKEALRKIGVQDEELEGSKELLNWLPAPQDLIRFAVREVYSPEQVKALDLDADFPQAVLKDAKKVGVSEDVMHQFWQAHWELPSPTQLFEMYHRTTTKRLDPTAEQVATIKGKPIYRTLGEESLKNALKANDIAPIWRDKFLEISNSPLTRVDVRRMYELGILTKDEVFTAYLDDGYSVENAHRLADFVEADIADNYRGEAKSLMLSGYRKGVVSRGELMTYLKEIKMPLERINELIMAQDEMTRVQFSIEQVDNLKGKYMNGFIAEKDLPTEVGKLGLRPEVFAFNIVDWRAEKLVKEKRIAVATLARAYKRGIVPRDKFLAELKERNYQTDDALILADLQEPDDDTPV